MAINANASLSTKIREFVEYRRAQLTDERRKLEENVNGLNGAALVGFGERVKVTGIALAELEAFASWMEVGYPVFVPPLTAEQLGQWRFARDQGADVPPHIAAQLDAKR